ncbi:MAG: hypothetical protein U5R30_08620 [Deltaproteobacteria bacterium]|jgi:hypothetical protein|nr:hypothetical protein [Deltaproteobacteria bacterium]
MDSTIYTLQDYMLRTESIIYILIVATLIGITGFWLFLSGRDED